VANDLGQLVAIVGAIGAELYRRGKDKLASRPQLAIGLGVLLIAICLVLFGKAVSWVFSADARTQLGRVSGTVVLYGRPLPRATIEFSPAEGSPSYGITDSKGRYTLQYLPNQSGAEIGRHTVRITTYDWQTTQNGGKLEVPEQVPVHYNSETTLEADIQAGSQSLDWDLQKD
jgi:hypothetical protein